MGRNVSTRSPGVNNLEYGFFTACLAAQQCTETWPPPPLAFQVADTRVAEPLVEPATKDLRGTLLADGPSCVMYSLESDLAHNARKAGSSIISNPTTFAIAACVFVAARLA